MRAGRDSCHIWSLCLEKLIWWCFTRFVVFPNLINDFGMTMVKKFPSHIKTLDTSGFWFCIIFFMRSRTNQGGHCPPTHTGPLRMTSHQFGSPIPHNCQQDEELLLKRIVSLASDYGRYGYRRITALLRHEGWFVNHKRVERIGFGAWIAGM